MATTLGFRFYVEKASLIIILTLQFLMFCLIRYLWPSQMLKNEEKKTFLFCPVRSAPSHLYEYWVCLSLLKRGHNTFIILDSRNILRHAAQNGRIHQNVLLLKYFTLLAKIVSGGRLAPIEQASCLLNYDFSYDVHSSSKRIREMDTSIHIAQGLEEELTADINNIYYTLEKLPTKFDCVFMSHGIYSNWGPIKKFFASSGIKTIIYGNWPYFDGIFHLNNDVFQISTPVLKLKPLTIGKDIVTEWYGQRVSHAAKDQNFLIEREVTWVNELERYIDPQRPYLAFFPNCTWDGNLLEKSSIFFDQLECIKAVVQNLNSDVAIVIRVHPAEASVWQKSRSILSQIELDNRTIVIPANSPISSYAVASGASKIVIYDGIMVGELGYLEKEVAVPSKSVFSKLPNAVQFRTKEEFISWLNQPHKAAHRPLRQDSIDWMHEKYFRNGFSQLGYPREGERLRLNSILLVSMIAGSEVVEYLEKIVDENKT